MSTLGLYRPGTSLLHRVPAGWKLASLAGAGAGAVFLDRVWQVVAATLVVLSGYLVAGLPVPTALRQVRSLLWVGVVLAAFHLWASGWERAVVVVGVIGALVMLAGLVTLTTRTTDMVDALVRLCRPLRTLGARPDRVGLLLALGVRSVPVLVSMAEGIRDGQRARGLTASPRAFAVPLLVRSLRHADALAEALVARGLDD